jgi:prevent-host-death family protein
MSRTASVAALKAQLSAFLAGVKAGGTVVVTERGKPVATLQPCPTGTDDLQDLVRAGVVRPPRVALGKDFWRRRGPEDPRGRALSALRREREEGR